MPARRIRLVIVLAGACVALLASGAAGPAPDIPPVPPRPPRAAPASPRGAPLAGAQNAAPTTGTPTIVPIPAPRLGNAALLDELARLAFDADARSQLPARTVLTRWAGPLKIYVWGDAAAHRTVQADAAALEALTGLPTMTIVAGQPNVFVAVADNPLADFAGPLRQLLELALPGGADAVPDFLSAVVGVQACWVMPVWADAERATLKAAVIGVDARQGHPALEHCLLQKLAASLGLLGPEGSMPRSVFDPRSMATRLSFEDRLLIRVLYAPELVQGQSREAARAAADTAIRRLRSRPAAPGPGPGRVVNMPVEPIHAP